MNKLNILLFFSLVVFHINSTHIHSQIAPNISLNLVENINGYKNITNMKGSNWVFGNITEGDYYLRRYDISTNNNVTQCPVDQSFV